MWEENSPSRYKMSLLRRFLTQFTWRIHPTSSRHVVGFCLFGIYNINTVVDIRFWHCQMTHKIHINIKGGAHRDGTLPFSYILPLPSYIGIGPCPIHRNATLCTFRSENSWLWWPSGRLWERSNRRSRSVPLGQRAITFTATSTIRFVFISYILLDLRSSLLTLGNA